MDGTLSRVDLGPSVRYQLTRKEEGRTKTIYVRTRAAKEVGDWTGRWREVRELLKELGEFSRGVFPSVKAKPARTDRGSSPSGGGSRRKSRKRPFRAGHTCAQTGVFDIIHNYSSSGTNR